MEQNGHIALPDAAFRLSPQQAFLLDAPAPLLSQCAALFSPAPPESQLRARLDELVQRHEVLRTTFVTPPGARLPVGQTIHEQLAPEWHVETGEDSSDGAALDALLQREAAAHRDRGADASPLRVYLRNLPGERCLVVVTASAACADPASLLSILADLRGAALPPAADPIQHADYAQWRSELLADAEAQRAATSFWQAAREAAQSRPARTDSTGALRQRLSVLLDPAEQAAINAAADQAHVHPADFALAAWSALLSRLSGVGEILIAVAADGRNQPDLEDAVGPYAQPAPVLVRIDADTSFAEVLDQVRRGRREAESLQDFASEADLALVAQRATAGFSNPATGTPRGVLRLRDETLSSPVHLHWDPSGQAEISTAKDVPDPEALAGYLRRLLVAAASDPAQPVDRLPLLDGAQRCAALAQGRGDDAIPAALVHHAFEAQAHRSPALPAVVSGGEQLTFGELNRSANRLAHHLRELGAARDAPVALCMGRSASMISALLGILKAGAGYLPLNPAHPSERILHQLTESGADIVVTETAMLDRLAPLAAASIVCLDRDAAELEQRSQDDPPQVNEASDLAYVLYTSGSTGRPKGVAVTHGNLSAYTAAIVQALDARQGLHFAAVSELSTDLGNTAIFPSLITGGCLHVIDAQMAMDGLALAAYAQAHPLDVIKITPTHLRALLAASDQVLPRHCLVLGGEALSWDLVARVRCTGTGCRILNHYGPTETTVGCCTFEVRRDAGPSPTVPIGRPLPGVRAYVLDRHLEPVPVGVAGELCIAGAGVARGYVRRPQETSARFVPEVDDADARMYRTGDRARFLPDGTIEFLGRLDDQVKIRGFRVEPGEIEAALRRHPGVREAAVVAVETEEQDRVLVAYIVSSAALPAAEWQSFLARSLPEHMVPSRFVAMDALPLTASGKLDRRSLPDPSSAESPQSTDYVGPRDDVEEEIAAIWAQLLGAEKVGIFDDFFALGGHSLLATQAIMRIRRKYGALPLGAMFNAPTVAALAQAVRAAAA